MTELENTKSTAWNDAVAHARLHSPFYRERLWGIPENAPLSALPFTTAGDLQECGMRMVCVPASEVSRIVTLKTSGTTAKPKRVFFTAGDIARTAEFFRRGMSRMTKKGERAAIIIEGYSRRGISDILQNALEDIGVTAEILTPAECIASQDKYDVIIGAPWQTRLCCRLIKKPPERVLLSGDYVPATAQTAFGEIRVFEHFGMTETCFGFAVNEAPGTPMKIRKDAFFTEILDAKTGRVLAPGQIGELCITSLKNEAMPLLRYRTGDLAVTDKNGDLVRVFGRVENNPERYRLQDALFARADVLDIQITDGTVTVYAAENANVSCIREGFSQIIGEIIPYREDTRYPSFSGNAKKGL